MAVVSPKDWGLLIDNKAQTAMKGFGMKGLN